MARKITPAVAGDVRSYFRSTPDHTDTLTEAAQATVAQGARGKVHPDAIAEFNRANPATPYAVGNAPVVSVKVPTLAADGRTYGKPTQVDGAEYRALAGAGKRGRISAAGHAQALASLSAQG